MSSVSTGNQPLVSVIVICWNNKRFLKRCFDSLMRQSYKNIEIILTDNGSHDGSVEFIKENYQKVKVIENKKNLGFAEGNNVALRQAQGRFVFILNPDTEVHKDCIRYLVEMVEQDERIGSCTPKIYIMDRGDLINSAGGDMLLKSGDNIARGFYLKDEGQFNNAEEVFGPSAGAGFYRRSTLEQLEYFDKGLFTYYEDVDLNIRMQLFGWQCMYVPQAMVYHYQSGTLDDFNWKKEFYLNRNKYYTILKNYSFLLQRYCRPQIIRSYLAMWKRFLLKGNLFLLLIIHISLLSKMPRIVINRIKLFSKIGHYPNTVLKDWLDKNQETVQALNTTEALERYYSDLKKRI